MPGEKSSGILPLFFEVADERLTSLNLRLFLLFRGMDHEKILEPSS